jgi:hypothetical protein
MSRSHALLHCPNARLAAARTEAWEGRDPRSVWVLLSNPRWERRLLRFLEMSGVGRVMAGGRDRRGWRPCRSHGRVDSVGSGGNGKLIVSLVFLHLVKGDSLTPRASAHSAPLRAEDIYLVFSLY